MGEMQPKSDAQLLREYAESGSESAFTELVARHTDLVYSAALRQVPSSDLACDVAQNVFTSLARGARTLAGKLNPDASLAGWLCRCTRNLALNLRRDDFRRQSRERQAMETLHPTSETAPDWGRLCPLLDEAISGLNEVDHDALVLRFFKNHDLRSVGLALGVSDDTAQKRVARALEKLRDHLAHHGITTTGAALAMAISANAVQAAPVELAATISTAATLAGTTLATTTTATAIKTIAMTTIQKTLITATIAAAVGAGIYEARQASRLREENQSLQQQQAPLAEQNRQLQRAREQLQRERDDATNQLAALTDKLAGGKQKPSEVLKLRGEVGVLLQEKAATAGQSAVSKAVTDPDTRKALRDEQKMGMTALYSDLAKRLNLTPDQAGQLNDLLADHIMDSIDLITQALHDKDTRGQIDQLFAAQDSALRDQLQTLVGPDGVAQYLDYTKNLGSTLTAAQFAGSLTGDPAAVAEKKSQLLQAMQQATQSTLAAAGLPADYQTVPMLNFANIASEEQAAQSLQLMDSIYAQVAARASSFLSADELNKFQEFRTNAIQRSQTMLLVNRKMMAPISK
jgi:RNA polymerase sigma factor (sigma-70 family)